MGDGEWMSGDDSEPTVAVNLPVSAIMSKKLAIDGLPAFELDMKTATLMMRLTDEPLGPIMERIVLLTSGSAEAFLADFAEALGCIPQDVRSSAHVESCEDGCSIVYWRQPTPEEIAAHDERIAAAKAAAHQKPRPALG